MNLWYGLIGAAVLLAALVLYLRSSAPAPTFDEYYDEDEWQEDAPPRAPAFQAGGYYIWQHIEPFIWALGYSEAEAQAMYTRGYAGVFRNGFRAEFDATLGQVDRAGEPVFVCHMFDSHADTERHDRWSAVPDAQALEVYR